MDHAPAIREGPLRIAMVVPPWYSVPPPGYGGLEQVVAGLVDGLAERGHQVTLFGAGDGHGTEARFVPTVGELQHDRLGESLPELAHLARVHRALTPTDFDVVHDHTTIGPLLADRWQLPTVATVHGNPVGEYGDVLGEVSLLAPLDYSGLVWAALLGFLLWGDIPGTFVWVGAAIIVTAGIYIVRREAMLRRRGKPRGS